MRPLALVLGLALWAAQPLAASADTVSPEAYRLRLLQVRELVDHARRSGGAERTVSVGRAVALLRQTDAITLASGTYAVDDRALADRIEANDASLASALALIDSQLAVAERAAAPAVDGDRADAVLRDVLRETGARGASPSLLDAIVRALTRFVAGLEGPRVDFGLLWPVLGALGAAVIFFVVATLGRGLGERVRSEVALRETGTAERPDPSRHLRAADEALAAGRPRDAIHSLYLFALAALVAREAIRFDPALTDRELLVRAAAVPHADALRDLVALYERSWFGLRDLGTEEARRARSLALRVAG